MRLFSRNLRTVLLTIASAAGYGIGIASLIILSDPARPAPDAAAYYGAGRAVLEGGPLYGPTHLEAWGAYRYPPIFAQLWSPLTLLPELAFAWVWRLIAFASLVWLAGSWRNVGLWLLFPITINELANPNVTLPVAAMTFAALRGNVWLLPWASLLKYGPFLVAPYLWLTRREERRPLALAGAVAAGACLVSFAVSPGAWAHWWQTLVGQSGELNTGLGMLVVFPTALADFVFRLALALALVAAALAMRSERVLWVATTITVPTLWITRLVPLLALYRLPPGQRPLFVAGDRLRALLFRRPAASQVSRGRVGGDG